MKANPGGIEPDNSLSQIAPGCVKAPYYVQFTTQFIDITFNPVHA